MSIQSLDAISAYARAVQRPGIAGVDAGTTEPAAGGTFASMVETIVSNTIETGKVSERAVADHIQGKAELVDVVTAVNAAEMSLETLVAVRDKVIAAYQDIMRMPI
jgi:flagellar hook-basal body complex protein FliE